MNVSVLARPDHSVALVEGLRALGARVDYHTFYALEQDSPLRRLMPKRKTVPAGTHVSYAFTALAYPLMRWRRLEEQLGNVLLRPVIPADTDIIHYWPFYFGHWIERHRSTATVADYYEAEPSFVNALFRAAYERIGLPFVRPVNEMIDQNAAFRFETHFLVASEYARRTYARRFPDAQLHVAGYGMTGMRLQYAPRATKRRIRWVFVGRVSVEKGVHVLLDVMAREPGLELDLIGPIDPAQQAYFAPRIGKNVRHVGHLRRSEVLERLPGYDAFVMPSLSDAYSIATIEALCAGLPVVITRNCGNADDLAKHQLGEVVPIEDAQALRAAMLRVTEHTDTEALAARLQSFEQEDRAQPYAKRVLDVYHRILRA